jgi:peptidoglycan/xylan/chitin deacetylase (PgdA/CDA1 family)
MSLRGTLIPLRDAARRVRARLVNPLDPPLVILLYHRVCDLPRDEDRLAVRPAVFRAQLERVRARMPIVRLDEPGAKRRGPAAAITFDDGYADNLEQALPILESLEAPATFFVTTGNVESGREFWWDELDRLVLEGGRPERFRLEDPAHGAEWPSVSREDRVRLFDGLHARLRHVDAARRERWFEQLRAWAAVPLPTRPSHRPLAVEELRRLAASPWAAIGAHTVTHTPLSALDREAQREEIEGSKRRLEQWLGRPVTLFSYPFGERRDFTAESVRLCRAAGFQRTAANLPGTCHRWTDPQRLPRHVVRDWPADEFERRLRQFVLS